MDRFREMEVFAAIADAGSFAKAAEKTRLSRPAVTRLIAELEARVGTRLIQRTTRSMRLTEAGLRYLDHARRVLQEVEAAERDLAGATARPRGKLTVTAPTTFGRLAVAPFIAQFLRDYQDVSISLLLLDRIVNLIDEGIDVGVRIGALPDSGLIARKIGTVRRVLVASPAYLKAHGAPAHPLELLAHAFINFTGSPPARDLSFPGKEPSLRVSPSARLEVNDAAASIALAEAGHGITNVLSYMVAKSIRAGRLQEVLAEHAPPPRPVQLVYPETRLMAPATRAFVDAAAPVLAQALG